MKSSILAMLAILAIPAVCQSPSDVVASSLTFPLRNPPQKIDTTRVSVQLLDNPGPAAYCYWIVSNFTIGNSAPAGPICVFNGPNTLVSGIRVSWTPAFGANTYDVLRTSGLIPPSGACGCAIATGVSTLSATDTGLNAYTVNTFAPGSFTLVWDNEQSAAGQSQLVLRANGVNIYTLTSVGGSKFAGTVSGISTGGAPNTGLLSNDNGVASAAVGFFSSFGGVDQKTWDIIGAPTVMLFRAINDAFNNANVGLEINRGSGFTIASVQIPQNGVPFVMGLAGDVSLSRLGAGVFAIGNGTQGDFSGTLKTTTVNAVTGFQVNGAAPSGHFPRGNGTNYVDGQVGPADVTPGSNGQCLITTGGIAAWGSCSTTLLQTRNINTTAVTVNAATTGNQNLQSFTDSAGQYNAVNRMVKISAIGSITTNGAQTVQIIPFYNGTNLFSGSFQQNVNVSSGQWEVNAECYVTVSGSSGTLFCRGLLTIIAQDATTTTFMETRTNSALNLTTAPTIQMVVSFQTSASATNSCTEQTLKIEQSN